MNVAIIGSGGREHALAYKINQSKSLSNLFIIPGNPGTEQIGENVIIDVNDFYAIGQFCKDKNIELVVIGPEAPLVNGLSDYLRNLRINVFGPSSNAARIESEKSFAKKIMMDNNVSTAMFKEFTSNEFEDAKEYLNKTNYPCVIKADGLAAGKGVSICKNVNSAMNILNEIFVNNKFGKAGNKIIVEEFLEGEEASIFAITDGDDFVCLPSAQDHKRVGEKDTGLNTGGMGAYSPTRIVTEKLMEEIKELIIKPVLKSLRESGSKFIGCLYAGLMITKDGPKVIEFNCRFGDPETQAVLPLLKGDFLELLFSASIGKLNKSAVTYEKGTSICVVATSNGYPESYEKGFVINGLDSKNDGNIIVFHAGTKKEDEKILTNGGRVLGVTAFSDNNDFEEVKIKAYKKLQAISFKGMYYRNDIAWRVLEQQ